MTPLLVNTSLIPFLQGVKIRVMEMGCFLPGLAFQIEEAWGELMLHYSSQPKENGHPFQTCLDSFHEHVFSINTPLLAG